MTGELHYLALTELAAMLRARDLSPVEVTSAQLERISTLDRQLGSYALVLADQALADARRAGQEIAAGRYRGMLHGVPLGIKDLLWTRDIPTAAGMPIHAAFRPGSDATAVARLRAAGAVILGKQQMTEGAYSDYHPSVTAPKNPWDPALWPGISSSGPAVATAAGLCYGTIASDTGGSIRWPCAATGLTGIKPTWGRVSRFGAFALAPTMDHIGPIARSARDAAAILTAIAGPDGHDPTTLPQPMPQDADRGITGMRIGVDTAWNSDGVHACVAGIVADAAETLRHLGAEIVDMKAPGCGQAVSDWMTLCSIEASVAHAATFPARRAEYGPVLASVLDAGRAATVGQAHQAELRRLALRGHFARLFTAVDLLLTPVHPFMPLTLDDIKTLGERPDLIAELQRYTAPFDLTGNPTITIPGRPSDTGLPIGVQLIAGHQREDHLITAAIAFQDQTSFHRRRPIP